MSWKMMQTAAALGVLVSTACSGDNDAANAAQVKVPAAQVARPDVDPCTLLTPAEVEKATGWKVEKSEKNKYSGGCDFTGPNWMVDIVHVSLHGTAGMTPLTTSAAMAKWRQDQLKKDPDVKLVIEPIDDVGTPAIRNDFGGSPAIIESFVRGRLLIVSSPKLDATKALLRVAASRVP